MKRLVNDPKIELQIEGSLEECTILRIGSKTVVLQYKDKTVFMTHSDFNFYLLHAEVDWHVSENYDKTGNTIYFLI